MPPVKGLAGENDMAIEIERKFLLKNDGWRGLGQGTPYRQGYLSRRPESTVRVRVAGASAFLTIKGPSVDACALEFEYPLPVDDAQTMLDQLAERPLIDKVRYIVPCGGLLWEIDEFFGENQGLILAEVELSRPGQTISLPDWIGEEVTGDPRYFNSSLVKTPYRLWAANK